MGTRDRSEAGDHRNVSHNPAGDRCPGMSRAGTALLFAAILTVPAGCKADETYVLCGPKATGFVRSGKTTACINGSLDWRQEMQEQPAAQTPKPQTGTPVTAGSNTNVDDALNVADQNFNADQKDTACTLVSTAIMSANMSGASPEQKAQLKQYASRCNLRYLGK